MPWDVEKVKNSQPELGWFPHIVLLRAESVALSAGRDCSFLGTEQVPSGRQNR